MVICTRHARQHLRLDWRSLGKWRRQRLQRKEVGVRVRWGRHSESYESYPLPYVAALWDTRGHER